MTQFVMDRPLTELMYICTFRCNYNCEMCYQNSLKYKICDELYFEDFIDTVKNSKYLLSLKNIHLTGGEIFLKDNVVDFILELEKFGIRTTITSNGYFTDKIIKLLEKIKDINSIYFAISLDGLEETNNLIRKCKNGYQNTIETIKYIKETGVGLHINTVMQQKNIKDLEQMKIFFDSMGIVHCFNTLANDMRNPPIFTKEQIRRQLPYASTDHDKKYILTNGNYVIKNCHAGIQSCYINPIGNVYCCHPGESSDMSTNYLLGNVKETSFDTIWCSKRAEEVYNNTVAYCKGCYFTCEVTREVNFYNLSTEILIDEVSTVKNMITDYVDWSVASPGAWGWHNVEKNTENSFFRWMAKSESKVFLRDCKRGKVIGALEFKYMNLLPDGDIHLKIYVNNKIIESVSCNNGTHTVIMPIAWLDSQEDEILEVRFQIDHLWSPSDYGSTDYRQLGIAIYYMKLIYN